MSEKAPDSSRVRLTATRIGEWNPSKEAWLRDSESRLTVWCRPPGGKWYIFASHINGRAVRIRLGNVDDVDLHDARREAQQYQSWIAEGKDPREVRKQQKAAAEAAESAKAAAAEAARQEREIRQRYTLQALCDAYVAHQEAQGKVRARDARSAFKCHVIEARPDLAQLPAREITPKQVAEMVRKVREAGKEHMAGILRSYLSAAYTLAKRAPLNASAPSSLIPFAIEHNPVDGIDPIKVAAGNRTLTAVELRAYLATLGDSLPDQALSLAILAGGQRMEQLLRARVSDYDPETATLRLWDGKGKRTAPREHLLPLAPRGAALVARLMERASEKQSPLLFVAREGVQMVATTPGNRCGEISASMGGEPFNLRDVRRTVETMLAALGISQGTRAQLMSHGLSGVQAVHYDRHSYTNEKRTALVAWEARLAEIEIGERASNVVELRGTAVA